eukprot:1357156-Pyramimonas_sp.AAC.1
MLRVARIQVYALAAGNGMLFSGGQDKTIRVHTFNQADNSFVFSAALTAHTKSVHVLVVSGDLLFSGGGEGNIIMWSLTSGQPLQVTREFLCYQHTAGICRNAQQLALLCARAACTLRIEKRRHPSDERQRSVVDCNGLRSLPLQSLPAHSSHILQLVYWENHLLSCGLDGELKVCVTTVADTFRSVWARFYNLTAEAPSGSRSREDKHRNVQ